MTVGKTSAEALRNVAAELAKPATTPPDPAAVSQEDVETVQRAIDAVKPDTATARKREPKPADPADQMDACFFSLGQELALARYQVSALMELCGSRPTYATALRRLLGLSYALRAADHVLIDAAEAVDAGHKELRAHRTGTAPRERTP